MKFLNFVVKETEPRFVPVSVTGDRVSSLPGGPLHGRWRAASDEAEVARSVHEETPDLPPPRSLFSCVHCSPHIDSHRSVKHFVY